MGEARGETRALARLAERQAVKLNRVRCERAPKDLTHEELIGLATWLEARTDQVRTELHIRIGQEEMRREIEHYEWRLRGEDQVPEDTDA